MRGAGGEGGGALQSSGYREGLPASTGGVLSGFFPGSKGAERGGQAEGRKVGHWDLQHLDLYIIVEFIDSLLYHLELI